MSIIQGSAHTSAGGGYQIERSLRFNSADSAYLNRTPASASNRRTFTWSGWVKRCNSATTNSLFAAYVDANNFFLIQFRENADNGRFEVFNYSSAFDFRVETNALLRDPSAWYHIVVALDTTQATNSNRIKIYVNGTEQTLATTSYPSLDFQTDVNNTNAHNIGADGASGRYHNGYLTEINFIDGQALTPSSFGETDSATGVWKPKAFSGTYGTNGFYLKFADNSGTTSTTLGKDSSGNGNNWTPNNFSVTAGVGNDSLTDTPTSYGTDTGVGGEVRGNYATLNPLRYGAGSGSTVTISEGNLKFNCSSNAGSIVATINIPSSGKWYWEAVVPTQTYNFMFAGVIKNQEALSNLNLSIGNLSTGYGVYAFNGQKYNNGSSSTYMAATAQNTVMTVAYDADTGSLYVGAGGSWANGSGSTNQTWANAVAAYTGLTGNISPAMSFDTGNAYINFGQRPFAYTAPSGFKALCTQNLPTPTIGATSTTQADNYFDIVLRNGFGTSGGSITSVQFQPDFIWEKRRTVANHQLVDSVRGVTKSLSSNLTDAEATYTTYFTSFNSNGYTLGAGDYGTGDALVDWIWRAGGTGVTNTAGTITSTVSASTTSGFSIVTYTGTGSNATVGHGLGVAPSMIIVKRTNSTNSWQVYHSNANASPASGGLFLNTTDAFTTLSTTWNNTVPSSTVFSIGTAAGTNASGGTYVAYCFAPVAGYSAFGSYTGNGSTDGPFVYTGFRPRWVMVKSSTSIRSWVVSDGVRNPYNVTNLYLLPSASDAEATNDLFDFTSNGFKVRASLAGINESSQTFIYAAFAETPAKFSLAR